MDKLVFGAASLSLFGLVTFLKQYAVTYSIVSKGQLIYYRLYCLLFYGLFMLLLLTSTDETFLRAFYGILILSIVTCEYFARFKERN